jgi:DNA mismatch endonuclease (patch repair protein)
MVDIMSKAKRSALMSKIRGRDTGIERAILAEMKKRNITGFEYQPKIPGKPDFAFPDQMVAIFCDGNFWHGYKFDEWKKDLSIFWKKKIERNIRRDKRIRQKLRREGWRVVRLWGHQINKNPETCVTRIQNVVRGIP